MTPNARNSLTTIVQIIMLGAIWGGAFTLIKVLVHELSALEIAAGRLALGALAVFAFLLIRGRLRWPGHQLIFPIGAVAVLDTLVPYTFVGWAESRIDSGAAAVLISAMPLFTVMFASVATRDENIGPTRLAGVAVGFAGVLLLLGSPSVILNSGAAGQLAVVGAAASYAAGALYARTLLRRVDAPNLTAVKLTLGAGLASAATVITGGGGGLLALGAGDAAALLVLGVVCTGLGFVLYFRIVAAVGSIGASTVTYVIPVFGLLFGAVLLDESIGGRTFGAMALIVGGVAAVMYGPQFENLAKRIRGRGRSWSPA
jgi:drug/metabolite transporter (DMT)-like permease